MTLSERTTVGELAAEYPAAAEVLEKHHIEYCRGSNHSLADACRVAGTTPAEVIEEIEQAGLQAQLPDWNSASLSGLIRHIRDQHHRWLRPELALIDHLLARVANPPLQRIFSRLRADLEQHLSSEERLVFPAILDLEKRHGSGEPVVREFIITLEAGHDHFIEALDEIRDLTYGYAAAEDASHALRALYSELRALERNIHEHVHLESNILFPRALRLESK